MKELCGNLGEQVAEAASGGARGGGLRPAGCPWAGVGPSGAVGAACASAAEGRFTSAGERGPSGPQQAQRAGCVIQTSRSTLCRLFLIWSVRCGDD